MLKVSLTPYPSHLRNVSAQLFRQLPVRPGRFEFWPVMLSLSAHLLAIISMLLLLDFLPFSANDNALSRVNQSAIIYYNLKPPRQMQRVPKILPPGPGSIPGSGMVAEKQPTHGTTKSLGAIFAVSRPKLPDNDRQTILQSKSPPELRIKTDLTLPNLLVQNRTAPKVPLNFNSNIVRALAPSKSAVYNAEPNLEGANPIPQLTTILSATASHPRLAVPIGSAPAPDLRSMRNERTGEPAAPEIEGTGSTSGQQLLVLGTEPADATSVVALPQGNRFGQFSISPGETGPGTPGGTIDGVAGGGTGDGRDGGRDGAGVGHGSSGGGGGNSGTLGFVSLRGSNSDSENLSDVNTGLIDSMVFALPKITAMRHPGMVIAAGPIGGGGLGVYGALHCGKIYTVLLPMSGKNWTLQFCQTQVPGPGLSSQSRSPVVHMEAPLIPPEAEARYDFKRLPLPPEKIHKLIILKGTIRPEGTVENLQVHAGLLSEMDAAALRAFSQWTFKPAMRGGQPVSVDVLVGIPSDPPPSGPRVAAKMEEPKVGGQGTAKSY
jgi:hypothetical protein